MNLLFQSLTKVLSRKHHTSPVRTKFLNFQAHDGSRQFAVLPETCDFEDLRRHVACLPTALVTGFTTDHVTEMWLDFTFRGHGFTVNNQGGEYWFFVKDSACPDEILQEVLEHFASLLAR